MSDLKNLKILQITTISFLLAILPFASQVYGSIGPLIYKETHTYIRTIGVGNGYYHQYSHEGAISADARLVSSTGPVDFYYNWMAPWLKVWITNKASYEVTVQWV